MDELVKTNSFAKRNTLLAIRENELVFNHFSIDLESVTGFKYGIDAIRLDMYSIGRKYLIGFKTRHGEVKIVFKCYMGLGSKYFNTTYRSVLEEIWQKTVVRLVKEAIDMIRKGQSVNVGKCQVSERGISCNGELIRWVDLSYQKNYNRLTINSKSNPKVCTNLYYLENFNVDVLIGILHWVFDQDGIKELTYKNSAGSKSLEGR